MRGARHPCEYPPASIYSLAFPNSLQLPESTCEP